MTSTSLTEGVKSTFQAHHEEIRRRRGVRCDATESATFSRVESDGVDDPFISNEQLFVLYTLSQREFAPCPIDETSPAVCIYGVFCSEEDAVAHAAVVQQQHPTHSILIGRTHDWIVAHATMAHMQDGEYTRAHASRLIDAHYADRERHAREFQTNVQQKQTGSVNAAAATEEEATQSQQPTTREGPLRSSSSISASCRVEDQRLVVVSFLRDDATPPEFLFRVYACHDSEADADRYVRNVCGHHVRDFDIDVVKLCCWLFPQRMTSANARSEVYRDPELHAIMASHKRGPQEVEKFYKEMATSSTTGEGATLTTIDETVASEHTTP